MAGDRSQQNVISLDECEKFIEKWRKNPLSKPRIEKVVVNICVGTSGEPLERAMKILEQLTGQKPVKLLAKKTIKGFGIHRGEPIACKVTLRKKRGEEFLRRVLPAVKHQLKFSSFSVNTFSFGIDEHLKIPGTRYDPELGIVGMDICVSLERPGFRIARRKRCRSKVPSRVRISPLEAACYMMHEFNVQII